MKQNNFDCIVIGAGHAGAEAAHAAANIGAKTALITMSKKNIAQMSCNPAIGGLAKGQLACEIDALGGLMGMAIDAAGIQFRLLNRSKGPAVRSPRAQADRKQYSKWITNALEQTQNLTIIEAMVTEIITENKQVKALRCHDGSIYSANAVIITTGTFLGGLMHIGGQTFPGGRRAEPSAELLSKSILSLGLELKRLKTGTPPRIDASTVDYKKLQPQYGDDEPQPFSFMTEKIDRPQIPCWITYTNEKIHQLIRDNLSQAPIYTGQIKAVGPRYCPSIETKIVRFPERNRHQIFLEPEERQQRTMYLNGISTSLPKEVQRQILKLLPGTENARIIHYAYAIEYNYCPPTQLKNSLETKKIAGLFLAGQINGTSGYEEAAAQGIIAGINAAAKLQNKEPLILKRDQAYIAVMIDDLLTKGIDEPYRMFTSRAEYRLSLRADNADRRLTKIGRSVAMVKKERWEKFQNKIKNIKQFKLYLQQKRSEGVSLWDKLRRPNNELAKNLHEHPEAKKRKLKKDCIQAVIIDAKYQGYLAKQQRLAINFKALENTKIPPDLNFYQIDHLRAEAKEKLSVFQPATLAQASRISGINPPDITVIRIHMKKYC